MLLCSGPFKWSALLPSRLFARLACCVLRSVSTVSGALQRFACLDTPDVLRACCASVVRIWLGASCFCRRARTRSAVLTAPRASVAFPWCRARAPAMLCIEIIGCSFALRVLARLCCAGGVHACCLERRVSVVQRAHLLRCVDSAARCARTRCVSLRTLVVSPSCLRRAEGIEIVGSSFALRVLPRHRLWNSCL